MVQCINGLNDMAYELGDSSKWEYIFPHIEVPAVTTSIPKVRRDVIYNWSWFSLRIFYCLNAPILLGAVVVTLQCAGDAGEHSGRA